jgi:thioredoxin-related protein
MYKNSVHTSQETHYVSPTEPYPLMLFGEAVVFYCENITKHINKLCGQSGKYSNHWALKD